MKNVSLTASNIKYLIALHELDSSSERGIRCVDIAKRLNITKPSVHTMINNLRELGLVVKEHYGSVYLTDAGKHAAKRYIEHYSAIRRSMLNSALFSDDDCRDLVCKVLEKTVASPFADYNPAPLYGSD